MKKIKRLVESLIMFLSYTIAIAIFRYVNRLKFSAWVFCRRVRFTTYKYKASSNLWVATKMELEHIERALKDAHNMYSLYPLTRYSYARLIRLAIVYKDIVYNNTVCDNLYDLFTKKYGDLDMNKLIQGHAEYTNCKTTEENEYAEKIVTRIIQIERTKIKEYLDKFNYIMAKYGENFCL